MYFEPPLLLDPTSTFKIACLLFVCLGFFLLHWVQSVLCVCAWAWGHSQAHSQPKREDSWLSLRSYYRITAKHSWVSWTPPQSMLESWLVWFCAGLVQTTKLLWCISDMLWVQWSSLVQKMASLQSPNLWLLQSLTSSLVMICQFWRGWMIQSPFVAKYSSDTWSPPCNQLWVSTLTAIRCTKKFPWRALRATLTCGYWHTNLEGCLILYPFSKITSVDLPPGPLGSPTMDS